MTQAELCLKGTFVKASFIFVNIFLDIYENARTKNFISPSGPKHNKIINWNKKWQFLFLHFFVVSQKVFIFLRHRKEVWEQKKYLIFPLIPLGWQGLRLHFVELSTDTISVSLTIEIHKNNIDTLRVKIIKRNWHFQRVTAKYCRLFSGKLLSLSDLNLYSKSLLIGISANNNFRTKLLKKVQKVKSNTLLIYVFFVMITSICLSQISLNNQKWTLLRTKTYQAFLCHAQDCCL